MLAFSHWLGSIYVSKHVAKAYKYWNSKNYPATEEICSQILSRSESPDAHFLLAEIQSMRRENNLALTHYNKAILLNSDSAEFYIGRGILLRCMGKFGEAVKDLRLAQALEPDDARIYTNIALVHIDLGHLNEAEHHLRSAIALQPDQASAHCNLGLIKQWSGETQSAIEHFREAIRHNPELLEAYQNLILSLGEKGEFSEALNIGNQATEKFHGNPDLYSTIGTIQWYNGQLESASQYFSKALDVDPTHDEARIGLGLIYRDLRDYENAKHCFRQVIAHEPENAVARLNLSFLWLLQGDFKRGWPEYEQRYHTREAPLLLNFPLWDGGKLDKKKLLITSEQGLGDEIMFASCLPDVIAQAKHCTIACDERLVTLYRNSFPTTTVTGCNRTENLDWTKSVDDIDVQIPIGSLPLYFRQKPEDFLSHSGYLNADPLQTEKWKERLDSLGDGLKIGISWKGGLIKTRAITRSIPLHQWLPILQASLPSTPIHFVSLQYGDSSEIIDFQKSAGLEIHSWKEAIEDFNDTAALIQSLDLIISVQTAIVHLAGALGKKVWALIPYSPEWRYMSNGITLPWYPSARLFRQKQPGAWASTIEEVTKELAHLSVKS